MPLASTARVTITASSTTLKVGDQVTLTFDLILPPQAPGTTPVPGASYGNLYLGDVGNRPFSNSHVNDKKDFPIPNQLRVITPVTGADNVPPLIPAINQNGHLTSTFVVEGVQVGEAHLEGDFIFVPDSDPTIFSWLAGVPGKIVLTVIPK
jgi:hypothetical protein